MSNRLEDGPRLEDVTNLYGAGYESSVLQTAFLLFLLYPPALKSGVTIDNAFQAFLLFCSIKAETRQEVLQQPRFCFRPFKTAMADFRIDTEG